MKTFLYTFIGIFLFQLTACSEPYVYTPAEGLEPATIQGSYVIGKTIFSRKRMPVAYVEIKSINGKSVPDIASSVDYLLTGPSEKQISTPFKIAPGKTNIVVRHSAGISIGLTIVAEPGKKYFAGGERWAGGGMVFIKDSVGRIINQASYSETVRITSIR